KQLASTTRSSDDRDMKTPVASGGCCFYRSSVAFDVDLVSLLAALGLACGKAHRLALAQAAAATVLHRTEMHKHFAPVAGQQEAEALGRVEPLHFTAFFAVGQGNAATRQFQRQHQQQWQGIDLDRGPPPGAGAE